MPWSANDAERHTHKANVGTEGALRKNRQRMLGDPATKAALYGKRTLWSHGGRRSRLVAERIRARADDLEPFSTKPASPASI